MREPSIFRGIAVSLLRPVIGSNVEIDVIHRIPNGGRLGKASVREHENEAGEDRIENLQKSVR